MEDQIRRSDVIDALHGYFDGMLETDTICPKDLYNLIETLPSAQPETHEKRTETHACDLISRNKAIRWVKTECNPYGQPTLDYESGIKVIEHLERMSSAQPYTEEEIQAIQDLEQAQLDKAYQIGVEEGLQSAQLGIIRCKDCKHWKFDHTCHEHSLVSPMMANDFCSRAERRTDG